MPYSLDPDVADGVQAFLKLSVAADGRPPTVAALRAGAAQVTAAAARVPLPAGVIVEQYEAATADASSVPLRWYTRADRRPGSAIVYIHGGGMVIGSAAMFETTVASLVAETGVPFLSVDYRLAPEHTGTGPVRDCYAALLWLAGNAEELGVDPKRIAVMGESAGAGLAAGTALLARDNTGPALAAQLLLYPMLDDRTIDADPALEPFLIWNAEQNRLGWTSLLGEQRGTDAVSPYAAPARATDLSGLPPAYVEVGTLDLFRDEDIHYAHKLMRAGVPTELHVHPGVPHAFETFAPAAPVSVRSRADRVRRITAL